MHHVLSYSDSCQYWCLAYICEGTFDLRIFVAVIPVGSGVIGSLCCHHLISNSARPQERFSEGGWGSSLYYKNLILLLRYLLSRYGDYISSITYCGPLFTCQVVSYKTRDPLSEGEGPNSSSLWTTLGHHCHASSLQPRQSWFYYHMKVLKITLVEIFCIFFLLHIFLSDMRKFLFCHRCVF